jgi:hypothetical protein
MMGAVSTWSLVAGKKKKSELDVVDGNKIKVMNIEAD